MIAAIAAMQLTAAPVDQAMAMRTAKSYLTNELYAGKVMAPAALNPVLLKVEMGDTKLGQPVYYIFNTSTTFLVVAGDDRARQILMVGEQPLDLNQKMPDGLAYLLGDDKEHIELLQERPGMVVDPDMPEMSLNATRATYGPLLTCNWDQSAPYYNQCQFTYNNNTWYLWFLGFYCFKEMENKTYAFCIIKTCYFSTNLGLLASFFTCISCGI